MSPLEDKQVIELAETTWLVMNEEAVKRNTEICVHQGRTGRMMPATTIARYIRTAAEDYLGRHTDSNENREVRRYLRQRNNVSALRANGRSTYDIFVAHSWSNEVKSSNPTHYVSQSNKVEAEKQALKSESLSSEVTTTTLNIDGPLSEKQYVILRALRESGCSIKETFATRPLADLVPGSWVQSNSSDERVVTSAFSSHLGTLEEKGLIKRKVSGRRTLEVKMTPAGKAVLTHPERYRQTKPLLIELLQAKGRVKAMGRTVSTDLAAMVDATPGAVGAALRVLVDDGYIKVKRNSDIGPYQEVIWVGPKHNLDDDFFPIPLTTELDRDTGDEPQGEEPVVQTTEKESKVKELKASSKKNYYISEAIALLHSARDTHEDSDVLKAGVQDALKQFYDGKLSPLAALTEIERVVNR